MDWRKLGSECVNYAFTGFTGLGMGIVLGNSLKSSPYVTGSIFAVSFIAFKAIRCFIRSLAFNCDMQLSTYHIVKNIAYGLCSIATVTSLFALGVIRSQSFIVLGSFVTAYTVCEVLMGVMIKYFENDELIEDVHINNHTPWHVKHAYN